MYEYSTQTQTIRMSAEKLNAQEESQLKGNITYCLDEIASSSERQAGSLTAGN